MKTYLENLPQQTYNKRTAKGSSLNNNNKMIIEDTFECLGERKKTWYDKKINVWSFPQVWLALGRELPKSLESPK